MLSGARHKRGAFVSTWEDTCPKYSSTCPSSRTSLGKLQRSIFMLKSLESTNNNTTMFSTQINQTYHPSTLSKVLALGGSQKRNLGCTRTGQHHEASEPRLKKLRRYLLSFHYVQRRTKVMVQHRPLKHLGEPRSVGGTICQADNSWEI